MISSDKHLQSYNHIKSQSYEDLQNDPKLRKEFPHHKISPYRNCSFDNVLRKC